SCSSPATLTRRASRCTSRWPTRGSARAAAHASSAIPASASARRASTRWWTTARAAGGCRSTPPTACTARPATSRTRTTSSPGRRPKAARGRTTRRCSMANVAPESELWRPSPARIRDANLTRFTSCVNARRGLSYRELRAEVARVADGLRAAGVAAGDRVAGFVPNLPEAAIAMLATATIGAIWSSCSPDFGVRGVLDRFGQIAPRVLFTADGYFYAGKQLDSLASMSEVLAKLPSVERVVVIPYTEREPGLARLGAAASRAILWQEFGSGSAPPEFALHPFNHPLYVLYSSGTTGVPKCIVHGAGGTLLQHQKEHLLHTDLKRSDRLFYFTTCGWMMWNWLMSGLACGATLVLYDGSPFHPQPGVLWHMAEQERITIFGTSAKYLAALEKSTFVPAESVDLTALRTLLSTGSPLLPEGFDYVYRSVKSDLQLASISGGTDIVSCFALGCPTRPVYRGELQC